MDDLFADIDRSAKGVQRNLHDVDGTHDTGAEAARLEQKNPLSFRFIGALVVSDVVESGCSHVFQYTASNPVAGTGLNQFRCMSTRQKTAMKPGNRWNFPGP
jgi:hypothetical protein